ncbi:hypothetical protein BGW36DRAFT_341555 [Talaromyces proteolyticus]|uniref:Ketoreductase domain-containing protein n=1 Tax=Talaromyces proteolyticus TaxID=1131652 RepID=A0AAD4PY96_9EURO|nr:uncharacterized protein BGW36DRAFT_341555 [Talaromyces proteolyticus]KAH8697514.1 hypothetical protein BGW36DRAFT_341555 [Talaromyces proteolyticus]
MSSHVWLVTGCPSGFGDAFARELLSRGHKVIATARSLQSITALSNTGAHTLALDVTAPVEEVNKVVQDALSIYGRIDVLLSNAGFVHTGGLEETTIEEDLKVFQTNVFGALNLARAVLPSMRIRRSGTIVFISSMAGWVGSATMGTYAASKAAISIYAEALRDEVAEFGIQVAAIEPGGFRSSLLSSKNMKTPSHHIQDYDKSKVRATETYIGQLDQTQPGDVQKGIKIMVDIITGTGVAEGKTIPGRLVVGSDAYEMVRSVCDNHIKTFDDWKNIIIQTDHE